MAFAAATKNAAVDAITALGNWIALHVGDPGTTGASEVTNSGGSTYARQQSTFPAASAGATTGSEVTFGNIPAAAYGYWGAWSAVSAGTFRHGGALTPSMTLGGPGTLKVTPTVTFP